MTRKFSDSHYSDSRFSDPRQDVTGTVTGAATSAADFAASGLVHTNNTEAGGDTGAGVPFIVGAYAALPATEAEQDEFYRLLRAADWVHGLELPYPGDLADAATRERVVGQLSTDWQYNTITAIPGTMQNVGRDRRFGLASPDAEGRAAALEFTEAIRQVVVGLAEQAGRAVIRAVQLHSAPTESANLTAFQRSLEALQGRDWADAELVIEHCDAPRIGRKPEKGFLELTEEVTAAREAGVGVHLNWGRSCLEARDPSNVLDHVHYAGSAGVLRGLIFSGAGPAATQYGYEWIDGHLPHQADEPTSLLDDAVIADCVRAARAAGVQYLGAKICVPADAAVAERVRMVQRIYAACQC